MHPVVRFTGLPGGLTPQLVPEIYDIILDNIHDSIEDLSNCSVVCKSWLPICRHHLFNEVNYRTDFAQILSSSTHAALTISPYIRKVTVRGNLLVQDEKNFVIKSILHLPRLTSLRIEKFAWHSMQSTAALSSGSPLQILTVALQSVHFASFEILIEFLESFSALQELSLDNVTWDRLGCISAEDAQSSPDRVLNPSSLKKLYLASCHNMVLLNWLQYGVISDIIQDDTKSHRLFPHLVALSLPDILPGEVQTLRVFLEVLSESLEYLDVGILAHDSDGRNTDGFSNLLGLSSNTNLKSLDIHQITLFQFPFLVAQSAQPFPSSINSPYAWLPSFISTIQSTAIQSVGFRMWLSDESQLDLLPWSILSDVLLDIGLPCIRFHISGIGRNTELVEAWITNRLRRIDITKTSIQFEFCG